MMKILICLIMLITSFTYALDYDYSLNTNIVGHITTVQKFESNAHNFPQTNCTSSNDITKVTFIIIKTNDAIAKEYQFWIDDTRKNTLAMALSALNSGLPIVVQTDGQMSCAGNARLSVLNLKAQ